MLDSNLPRGTIRNEEDRRNSLIELAQERRSKFPYIDRITGKINHRWAAFFAIAGNLTTIPILFSFGLYAYNLYLFKKVVPQTLLPIIFIAIPLFLLVDPIVGFIYDRVHKRRRSLVQICFVVIGSAGLLVSQFFILSQKYTSSRPDQTFGASLGVALVSYSLINSNCVRNSFEMTPSQKSRKGLLYLENLIQAIGILLIGGMPFMIRNGQDACNCTNSCGVALSDTCTNCLQGCEDLLNSTVFHWVAFGCTIGFIVINVFAIWFVDHRTDTRDLPPFYSFNKRIFDFFKNPFLVSTTLAHLLETVVIFTFIIWGGFYAYREYNAPTVCVANGTVQILCTANDYMILFVLLVVLFAFFTAGLALIDRYNLLWYISTMLSFAAGVAILRADVDTTGILIAVFAACSFALSVLPTTKAYFSDSVYYDEYRTGYVLPHYLTFIYNLTTKIAFVIALGAIITNTDTTIVTTQVQETHRVNLAAGSLIIVATFLLACVKIRMCAFQLKVFDKIQLAIQRNKGDSNESITFSDPITNEKIRRPIIPKPHEDIRNMLYLDNFARIPEFITAYQSKYSELVRSATIDIWFGVIITIIGSLFTGFLYKYFIMPSGWLLLFPMMAIVIGIYVIIYSSNVRTTASMLQNNDATIDRDYFNKYAFYRKQMEEIKI